MRKAGYTLDECSVHEQRENRVGAPHVLLCGREVVMKVTVPVSDVMSSRPLFSYGSSAKIETRDFL